MVDEAGAFEVLLLCSVCMNTWHTAPELLLLPLLLLSLSSDMLLLLLLPLDCFNSCDPTAAAAPVWPPACVAVLDI
jgi:hypothetical protein